MLPQRQRSIESKQECNSNFCRRKWHNFTNFALRTRKTVCHQCLLFNAISRQNISVVLPFCDTIDREFCAPFAKIFFPKKVLYDRCRRSSDYVVHIFHCTKVHIPSVKELPKTNTPLSPMAHGLFKCDHHNVNLCAAYFFDQLLVHSLLKYVLSTYIYTSSVKLSTSKIFPHTLFVLIPFLFLLYYPTGVGWGARSVTAGSQTFIYQSMQKKSRPAVT